MGTHEDVAQDVERASWRGHIQASEAKEALPLLIEDIVCLLQNVRLTTDHELDVRSSGVAVNSVLLVEGRKGQHWLGANRIRNLLHVSSGHGQERGARVNDGFFDSGYGGPADLGIVHGESPAACLTWHRLDDGHRRKVASIVGRVDTAQHELSSSSAGAPH